MSKPGKIHRQIADLLRAVAPEGLTLGEIRERLALPAAEQQQLDRRKRDLKKWYEIDARREGNQQRYFFLRERSEPLPDATVSGKVRAEVLGRARGRCGMCGKTVNDHGIVLVVDHKLPQDWGGTNDLENLWAICEECNGGKKAHFSSQDHDLMQEVMAYNGVHDRIAKLLSINLGQPVSADMLEFVANADDWQKRTRELRYLGWEIDVKKKKNEAGRTKSFYVLEHQGNWPPEMGRWIQEYERDRARRNREKLRGD